MLPRCMLPTALRSFVLGLAKYCSKHQGLFLTNVLLVFMGVLHIFMFPVCYIAPAASYGLVTIINLQGDGL